MFCEGQTLPISENETLFQLIGTTYGGDGQETFVLPDLRSRLPIHQDNNFSLGQSGGVEEVTLTPDQIPAHSHPLLASADLATDGNPSDRVLGETGAAGLMGFIEDTTTVNMAPQAVTPVGGSQPLTNFQPYLCIDFIISLFGIFPSPT